MRPIFVIARHTALETLRARTLLWSVLALAVLTAASLFLRELAIADGQRLQTAFLGAASRLAVAFIAATVIIGAMVREFNEQGHLLLLSLPLARTDWLVGRFLGFAAVAALLALLAGIPVAALAGPKPALGWTVALALELLCLTAMATFAAVGLRQMLPALLVTLGFYVLARAIGGLQILAHQGQHGEALARLTDALALALPRLDQFAASARLVGDGGTLLAPVVQTLIYATLLITAAAVDVARRDL